MAAHGGAPRVSAPPGLVMGIRVCCGLFAMGGPCECEWVGQVAGDWVVVLERWWGVLGGFFGQGVMSRFGGVV